MRLLYSLLRRWHSICQRDSNNQALKEELQFHLDRETEENIARGMPLPEARKAAESCFGNFSLTTEETYAARGIAWLDAAATDCRFAVRGLRKNSGAAITIILLLSFGISAANLLLTSTQRFVLSPFRVSHPEALVRAAIKRPSIVTRTSFTYREYESMGKAKHLTELAAIADFDTTITTAGRSDLATANMVSGNYFQMLGVVPELGRLLQPQDEQTSTEPAVIISHKLWTGMFGKSPSIVGSTISVQGRIFRIAGVMPKAFTGTSLDSAPDLWFPFAAQQLLSSQSLSSPNPDRFFGFVGRLRPGSSAIQAEEELNAVYQASEAEEKLPNAGQLILESITQGAFALHDSFESALTLLSWGLVVLLSMICANVAGLLLAVAMRRERETALRVALGASRMHLLRRAMIESLALGIAGAGGGISLSFAIAPLLRTMLPARLSPISLRPDFSTSCYAALLAVGVSVVFGSVPAWVLSRTSPELALRRGNATHRAGVLSKTLLVLQLSFTFILLVGSGLLLHSYYELRGTNPGFDVEHLVEFSLNSRLVGTTEKISPKLPFALEERVKNIPGVRNASLSSAPLMRRVAPKTSVALPGQRIAQEQFLNTTATQVSASYFDTIGVPILAGVGFTQVDQMQEGRRSAAEAPIPAVINQAFARKLFPHVNPINKTFGQGPPGQVATPKYVVTGIAGDSRFRSLREELPPIFYTPLAPPPDVFYYFLYVRTLAAPAAVIGEVKTAQYALDPRLPVFNVVTMHERVAESVWQERLLATVSLVFALISVTIAVIGLHGLLSYDTTQRTREFGIRAAVGAPRMDLALMLLNELSYILVPGILLGVSGCVLAFRLIASLLYGVKPLDWLSFGIASVIVAITTAVSAWQPLHRSIRSDPATVLREEV